MADVFDREIKTAFLDASAIGKYYTKEHGSEDARRIIGPYTVCYTTSFCFGEALNIFKRNHTKGNAKLIKNTDAYLSETLEFIESIKDGAITIEEQNIFNRDVFAKVEKLVIKYKIDISDIFQLVSIQESFLAKNGISCTLVTSDRNLFEAAKSENINAVFIPSKTGEGKALKGSALE